MGVLGDQSHQIAPELRFSGNLANGLGAWYSGIEIENCWFNGNSGVGLHFSASSFVNAVGLDISDNSSGGLRVQRNAFGSCVGCTLENNTAYAVLANLNSIATVIQSVVLGPLGIAAFAGSYADIDCLSYAESYPEYPDCHIEATRWAAESGSFGEAWIYVAGEFSGALRESSGGTVYLYGSQQVDTGGRPNVFWDFSRLELLPYWEYVEGDDVWIAQESSLFGHTAMHEFSRALLRDESVLDGTLVCHSAADAWADPGVVLTGGSGAVSNCEHWVP